MLPQAGEKWREGLVQSDYFLRARCCPYTQTFQESARRNTRLHLLCSTTVSSLEYGEQESKCGTTSLSSTFLPLFFLGDRLQDGIHHLILEPFSMAGKMPLYIHWYNLAEC